jgi:branched-chain amino acid transport system permease protein
MFLQQLINGIMLGSTYSLVAIGYTLIFGVLNLLHFAHGEVFMLGAFIGLQIVLGFKLGIFGAMIGAMVATALVGFLIERVAFRPIKKEYFLAPLIATIGITIILQEMANKVFGSEPVGFPQAVEIRNFQLGPIGINTLQILILSVSIFLMVVLHLFVSRTRLGRGMRATAENATTARLLGVKINRIIVLTFMIASALAGAAGVLVGMAYNYISPYMGAQMAGKGFAIMLLGGLGNIKGAMLGGLILGVAEILSVGYLTSSYRDAFAFGVMILILIFKPSGLFGSLIHED